MKLVTYIAAQIAPGIAAGLLGTEKAHDDRLIAMHAIGIATTIIEHAEEDPESAASFEFLGPKQLRS